MPCSLTTPLAVVVPFCRDTESVEGVFSSLRSCSDELRSLRSTVIAINDVRENTKFTLALQAATDELGKMVPTQLIENPHSLGFVKSVNRGLGMAVSSGADVVLLSSCTKIYPMAVTEMRRVLALDSMIGFASPRSNGGGIASLPHQEEFRNVGADEAYALFCALSPRLPSFHYVPAAVESCVYVKGDVLKEFGFLDESYGDGCSATQDLVMRANRCGYRSVLANRAFVYHIARSSCNDKPKGSRKKRDEAELSSRYPEYAEHVRGYVQGAHYRAEELLKGLISDAQDRYDIIFDFSSFETHHNGTFEAGKQILRHAANLWRRSFNIYVLVDDEVARFHGLDLIEDVGLVPVNSTARFAIAFRFGQPFRFDVLARMNQLAVVNVYAMLDPIAWDCLYLNGDNLDEIWQAVFSYADAVVYLSEFAAEQFRFRFRLRPGLKEKVSYLSMDTGDYGQTCQDATPGGYLLVVGNALAHKHVQPTVEALAREFPLQQVVALGIDDMPFENVVSYRSGQLSDEELDQLFANSVAVIFPSFYEGFGIPVIRSLAFRKPVLARSNGVNRELAERLGFPADLILYDSTEEMIGHLRKGVPVWQDSVRSLFGEYDWVTSTVELGRFLRSFIPEMSFSDIVVPRIRFMDLLYDSGLATAPDGSIGELQTARLSPRARIW